MPWGVAAAGVGTLGGIMGAKSSAKSAEKAAEAAKAPWKGAQPYVLDGFGKAQDALNSALDMGQFKGPYTADMNPWQTQGLNTAATFAQNQGTQGANTVFGAGMDNIGQASAFGNNAASMFAQAGQDPTQQIMANANQYANNPYLNTQIDAMSSDVVRNLNENGLTSLDLGAAGSGNMNSSRTGVAQGIMQRGAAEEIANISANMRGQAYNNGLNMAQNQYNTGLTQQMNANGQLLQAGQFGADQIGNGLTLGYGAGNTMAQAGAAFQAQNQAQIDGQRAQFNDQKTGDMSLLSQYLGMIQGYQGGTVQAASTPSALTSGIQGALGGLSAYGQWNKSPSAPSAIPSTVGSTYAGIQSPMTDSLGSVGDWNMNGSNDFSGYA